MLDFLLGQMPNPDQIIDAATRSSWQDGLLVLLLITLVAGFGLLIRAQSQRHTAIEDRILNTSQERETRLAARVASLEDTIRGELLQLIRQNSETMGKVLTASDSICRAAERMTSTLDRFSTMLESRPCLYLLDKRNERDATT